MLCFSPMPALRDGAVIVMEMLVMPVMERWNHDHQRQPDRLSTTIRHSKPRRPHDGHFSHAIAYHMGLFDFWEIVEG